MPFAVKGRWALLAALFISAAHAQAPDKLAACAGCHGADGTGANGGPDLTSIPSARNMERVVAQVTNGGGGMPAFKGALTTKQINDVSAYVVQTINKGG